jgi:hypothetical protein
LCAAAEAAQASSGTSVKRWSLMGRLLVSVVGIVAQPKVVLQVHHGYEPLGAAAARALTVKEL